MRGAESVILHRFVRGRAVDAGDRDAQETEINPELRAMVSHVTHPGGADQSALGAFKEDVVPAMQRPIFGEVVPARLRQIGLHLCGQFVEDGQAFRGSFDDAGDIGIFPPIELIGGQDQSPKAAELGEMGSEETEGAGFVVWFPVVLPIGDAFEDFPRIGKFVRDVGEHELHGGEIGNGHNGCDLQVVWPGIEVMGA